MLRKNKTHPISNRADDLLIKLAVAYIVVASIGAVISIAGSLPAEFMGHVPATSVARDFWLPWGWGTGISPPFILIIVVAGVATLLSARVGALAVWRWLLTIGGLLFAIGQLGEPHTYQILSGEANFTFLRAIVVLGMITVPVGMALAGAHAIRKSSTF